MIYAHVANGMAAEPEKAQTPRQHSHYFKACKYRQLDVYRVLDIFQVTHPCAQHAIKKLLVAGMRGHKDFDRDLQDVIDTLLRWQEMRMEESQQSPSRA